MANLIQRVLVRTDLNLPTGLLTAQVAHLHAAPFVSTYRITPSPGTEHGDAVERIREWVGQPYMFVHGVPNWDVLNYFTLKAEESSVPFYKWFDTIYLNISDTKKEAFEKVFIGISIGPADSDEIKTIVGDLPLL
jgi:peptidyl-tRNA hydrolase